VGYKCINDQCYNVQMYIGLLSTNSITCTAVNLQPILHLRLSYNLTNCDKKNGTFAAMNMKLVEEVDVLFGPYCSAGEYVHHILHLFTY